MSQDASSLKVLPLAARARAIDASGIRRIFDLAASLRDPLDLSIGQPDFEVPPALREAAARAIEAGRNRYTPSPGLPDLRRVVLELYRRRYGVSAEAALITAGGSGGLTLAWLCLVNPGDEVLLPEPFFVSYRALTLIAGGVPVYYDTYPDFRLSAERIERALTPRTRLLVLNSPANPTGAAADEAALREIAALARRRGLFVISDEVYADFAYDAPHLSIARFHEATLVVNAWSKEFGVTGWRMGYALGPAQLIDEMAKLQQFTFVCAPAPFQTALFEHLAAELAAPAPTAPREPPYLAAYRARRDLVVRELAPRFRLTLPGGAFYAFPEVPPGPWRDDQEFAEAALKRGLLLVPGNAFSERRTHFRLSFAVSEERLARALALLNELAAEGAHR